MAVKRIQRNVKNEAGGYDVVHYETEAGLVLTSDGKNVEGALAEVDTKVATGKSEAITEAAKDATAKANAAEKAAKAASRPVTWTPTAGDVGAVPTTRKVNGKALNADISLTAADVGAVPTARKINGKALTADITLAASDVGADQAGSGTAAVDRHDTSGAPHANMHFLRGVDAEPTDPVALDADTLGGHAASYFVSKDELNAAISGAIGGAY